jgi:hypothetical protein
MARNKGRTQRHILRDALCVSLSVLCPVDCQNQLQGANGPLAPPHYWGTSHALKLPVDLGHPLVDCQEMVFRTIVFDSTGLEPIYAAQTCRDRAYVIARGPSRGYELSGIFLYCIATSPLICLSRCASTLTSLSPVCLESARYQPAVSFAFFSHSPVVSWSIRLAIPQLL